MTKILVDSELLEDVESIVCAYVAIAREVGTPSPKAKAVWDALRAALDAPQQEAVAWFDNSGKLHGRVSSEQLEQLCREGIAQVTCPAPQEADGYIYEYESPFGGVHRELTCRQWNGQEPCRIIPYYFHSAPSVLEQEARKQLGELLAVIHCDGGHYAAEHGITKATADAIAKWAALRAAPSRPPHCGLNRPDCRVCTCGLSEALAAVEKERGNAGGKRSDD